jgi:SNF2 family DNA or RNA helicase
MEIINNISKTLKDDLAVELKKEARVSIAASCFSMYAYRELKKQFEGISELRFMFTSPTFLAENPEPKHREFYIPRLSREKSLYGSEFELKLRNELTQKAIAKECAGWIKKKVKFRSNTTNELMGGFMAIETPEATVSYNPVQNFTTVDLGCEKGNTAYTMITKAESPYSHDFLRLFDDIWEDPKKMQDVTDEVIESISAVYQETPPAFIYFITLYNIFREFLEDLSEDELPNEKTGYNESLIWKKLYPFQRDAALAIINKLERYNGCILADSVGLGKTFTALAVIKYYENRNKSVLVLCPKKLQDNWNTFKGNYVNNPIAADRLNYHVLFHTDLSRENGSSNGIDLNRLNWGNFDLVVIDESHNFRNGGAAVSGTNTDAGGVRENRYLRLLNRIIKAGVKTKVLMLSATPVNNRFYDLYNQLKLAYEGDPETINEKLNLKKDRDIEYIFRQAQQAFNEWSRKEAREKTTENLLQMLNFDFFEVLDSVTIARSRKHIEKYYDAKNLRFPRRNKPITERPFLTTFKGAVNYNEIYQQLESLNLSIYTPSHYILPGRLFKYEEDTELRGRLTQTGREKGIQHMMNINLLKRLESSVHSFKLTLSRIRELIGNTIAKINSYDPEAEINLVDLAQNDFDLDDENTDLFTVGRKIKIALKDMDYISWRNDLAADMEVFDLLVSMVSDITPEYDNKLQTLFVIIKQKIENPINAGNKKILIFSAFADTVSYLYDNVSAYAKNTFNLNTAMITGTIDSKATIPKLKTDFNSILTAFSPLSKINQPGENNIDILIGTDCISEGQNLQDCDYCINYDIHWNPIRIIQRFGRIDRIGSQNSIIQLVNFWPDMDLDEYINLKDRVETRMKISVLASTGTLEDNPIDNEKGDLEYRRAQLKRLQEEVVDIEEMQAGISIMDLGLNEFRLDLLESMKRNPDIESSPHGLYAIVPSSVPELPPGIIYVLKNINKTINIDKQNRLHPFYMVYIDENGEVICDHLSPKKLLDEMCRLCQNRIEPYRELCGLFNLETKDGRDMSNYSKLLQGAIQSIVRTKEEKDIDSLFRQGGTTALDNNIKGIEDFELIAFLVVRKEK